MAEGCSIWCVTVGDWKTKRSKIEQWYSATALNEDVKERKKEGMKDR